MLTELRLERDQVSEPIAVLTHNRPHPYLRYNGIVPTISDDEAALVVEALEHYDAYLTAMKREDGQYKALAERLQRKPPGPEVSQTATKRKNA